MADGSGPAEMRCCVCGVTTNLNLCSGCQSVYYCGPQCQAKDWPTHKPFCIERKKQLAAQAAAQTSSWTAVTPKRTAPVQEPAPEEVKPAPKKTTKTSEKRRSLGPMLPAHEVAREASHHRSNTQEATSSSAEKSGSPAPSSSSHSLRKEREKSKSMKRATISFSAASKIEAPSKLEAPSKSPLSSASVSSSAASASASADDGPVFGVPFEEALRRSAIVSPDLPNVMSYCLANIELRGIDEEGVFRVSGSVPEMNKIFAEFQNGQFPPMDFVRDVNVVTSLLKRFFREMPQPMFEPQSDAPEVPAPGSVPLPDYCRAVLSTLTKEKRKALYALFSLLVKINANRKENMMDAGNLAIVFSPTLGTRQDVVQGLIESFDEVFTEKDVPRLPKEWPNITAESRYKHGGHSKKKSKSSSVKKKKSKSLRNLKEEGGEETKEAPQEEEATKEEESPAPIAESPHEEEAEEEEEPPPKPLPRNQPAPVSVVPSAPTGTGDETSPSKAWARVLPPMQDGQMLLGRLKKTTPASEDSSSKPRQEPEENPVLQFKLKPVKDRVVKPLPQESEEAPAMPIRPTLKPVSRQQQPAQPQSEDRVSKPLPRQQPAAEDTPAKPLPKQLPSPEEVRKPLPQRQQCPSSEETPAKPLPVAKPLPQRQESPASDDAPSKPLPGAPKPLPPRQQPSPSDEEDSTKPIHKQLPSPEVTRKPLPQRQPSPATDEAPAKRLPQPEEGKPLPPRVTITSEDPPAPASKPLPRPVPSPTSAQDKSPKPQPLPAPRQPLPMPRQPLPKPQSLPPPSQPLPQPQPQPLPQPQPQPEQQTAAPAKSLPRPPMLGKPLPTRPPV